MKEYRINEKQLEKLGLYLEELSGVHKDMMGDDGCVNLRDLEDARGKLSETIRELGYLVEDIENQSLEDVDDATKLKPCPFCGGKVQVKKTVHNGRIIKCQNCKVLFALSGVGNADIDERIREAWNRRTTNERDN